MKKLLLTSLFFAGIISLWAQTPSSYYPFTGNANDAVGSNNGTVSGAGLSTDRLGNANSAYAFDGLNDYISMPSSTFTAYTLSAWVKFTGATTFDQSVILFTAGNPFTGTSHQIRTNSTGKFAHYTFDGSSKAVVGTTTAVPNTWYHVTITAQNSGQMRLYVNGLEEGTAQAVSSLWGGGNQFWVGSSAPGAGVLSTANFLAGTVDEIKVFTSALNGGQVLAEYNGSVYSPSDYRTVNSGSWSTTGIWETFNGSTWVPALGPPTSADATVYIRGGDNVTLNDTRTVDQVLVETGGTLTLDGGTLTMPNIGVNDVTIAGSFVWNSGSLVGPGKLKINSVATGTFSSASSRYLTSGAVLHNAGTLDWTSGYIYWQSGTPSIVNSGAWNINTPGYGIFYSTGYGKIENSGTITKTGASITYIQYLTSSTNSGTINVDGGELQFAYSAITNTGNIDLGGGTFNTSTGSVFDFNTNSTITGTGGFTNGGTMNLNINLSTAAGVALTNNGTIAGTGNLTTNGSFANAGNISTSGNILTNGSFTWSAGTISGAGTFVVTNNATWTGGTLQRIFQINSGQTLTLGGTGGYCYISTGGVLQNQGTVNWYNGYIYWQGTSPSITNSGTFNIDNAGYGMYYSTAYGSFINTGTINKLNAYTVYIQYLSSSTNSGTINVDGGELQFAYSAITNTGNIDLGGGTFNSSTGCIFDYNTGSTITGTGGFTNGGTMNLNINLSTAAGAALTNAGIMAGTGNITTNGSFVNSGNISTSGNILTNGSFTWSAGTISGAGTFVVTNNATWTGGTLQRIFQINSGQTLTLGGTGGYCYISTGGVLQNQGTVNWYNGYIYWQGTSPSITNSGTFNIDNAGYGIYYTTSYCNFSNTRTINKLYP